MRAHLFIRGIRIEGIGVDKFGVPLDAKPFSVVLKEAPEGVQWFAKGDDVLRIKETPDGKSASITATEVGTSIIHLIIGRGDRFVLLKKLRITVLEDPTVKVEAEFTNVRVRTKT